MEEKKTMSMKEEVDYLMKKSQTVKKKRFGLPRKGRLSKSKMKKGYVTVMRIDDNRNVDFEKQKIMDSTYRLSTKEYHVTNEQDILSYKGKPLIIQPTKKINPYNPLKGKNETYGQKYIMARMLSDTIKVVAKGAKGIMTIIGICIVAYIGYSIITGGF